MGIVGFGRIGKTIAKRIAGLGVKCVAYDPLLQSGSSIEGVSIVEFKDLLEKSDFITVHVPLNDKTIIFFLKKSLNK